MKKQNIYIGGGAEFLASVRPKRKHNKVVTCYRCICLCYRSINNTTEGGPKRSTL